MNLRRLVTPVLASSDVDLHLVSKLLGHSSVEVTAKYYARHTIGSKRRTVERLEELLGLSPTGAATDA